MRRKQGICCDICQSLIIPRENMTDEDFENSIKSDREADICFRCKAPIQLGELIAAKQYLNSDYFWKRKRELDQIIANF